MTITVKRTNCPTLTVTVKCEIGHTLCCHSQTQNRPHTTPLSQTQKTLVVHFYVDIDHHLQQGERFNIYLIQKHTISVT